MKILTKTVCCSAYDICGSLNLKFDKEKKTWKRGQSFKHRSVCLLKRLAPLIWNKYFCSQENWKTHVGGVYIGQHTDMTKPHSRAQKYKDYTHLKDFALIS